jgi:hypothetical protein
MGHDIREFVEGSLEPDSSTVLVANGVVIHAAGSGKVKVVLEEEQILEISALFVPGLSHNLISVRFLQKEHSIATLFDGDKQNSVCQLLQHGKAICTAPFVNGLWVLGSHKNREDKTYPQIMDHLILPSWP